MTVSLHVWGDYAQAERGQEGDLVAPAEGEVGPAVDEEDGACLGGGGGCGEEVVIVAAIEGGVFVLDSRVVGFEL